MSQNHSSDNDLKRESGERNSGCVPSVQGASDSIDFLTALEAGLDVLEERLGEVLETDAPSDHKVRPVLYDPARSAATADECLIGVGRCADLRPDTPAPIEQRGICLNDKGIQVDCSAQRQAWIGVTALAMAPGQDLLAQWQRAVGNDAAPTRFFRRFTLVVEDASPDSCLGLVALLATLNGLPSDFLPPAWIRYVSDWERGASRVTDPYFAWGPLLAALAHGICDIDVFSTGREHPIRNAPQGIDQGIGEAWLACLRFTVTLLRAGSPPDPIEAPANCPQAARARAFLHYEQQVYRQTLEQAQLLQLLLPMSGPDGRYKVIDACLLEETVLTGATKIFLRNDRAHTWIGDGFGLMAVHRPALAGSGDDIVISVDPDLGVHLGDLWRTLEGLEDVAWQGERPSNDSRELASYPDRRRPETGKPSPDQPWWDERGSYGLLAAPRRLADGRLGSRLDWRNDVLVALWTCYRPDRLVDVICGDGELIPLTDCRPEPIGNTGKMFLLLRWPTGDRLPAGTGLRHREPILLTPTLQRCLAVLLRPDTADAAGGSALADLPPVDGFDFLQVSGGYVLTDRRGVVLLDDWQSTPLCESVVMAETRQAAERLTLLEDTGSGARRMLSQLHDWISQGRWRRLGRMRTLDRLSEIKIRIREGLTATASVSDDPRIAAFRHALERRWGVATELETIEHTLDEMEQTLRSYAELKSGRLINFLTVFGFPLALFAGFFSFVFDDMPRDWPGLIAWLQAGAGGGGPNWIALAAFAGLSMMGMVVITAAWWIVRWVSGWRGGDRDH